MSAMRGLLVAAALLLPAALAAQQRELSAQLAARGLPPDLVQGVAAVAADATSRGLPAGPLVDKALEGWAKRVPAAQVLAVVRLFAGRMGEARQAVVQAGVTSPPGEAIAAAAEAMGRGIAASLVVEILRAAPDPALAAPGLRVAAALAAQGLTPEQAAQVVSDALRGGRTVAQLLDLPSAMRAMQAQGLAPPEIGRRMLQGGGHPDAAPLVPGGIRPPLPAGPGTRPREGTPPPPPGSRRPPRRP